MGCIKKFDFQLTKLSWERIFLEFDIETDYQGEVVFKLVRVDSRDEDWKKDQKKDLDLVDEKVRIYPDSFKDGVYSFSLNVSAADGRSFLNNGQWQIVAVTELGTSAVYITTDIGYRLDDLCRVFRYGRGKYAYNVSFSLLAGEGDGLELLMHSYFMMQNKTWKKRRYIQEALTFKGKFDRFYMYTVIRCIRLFYKVVSAITPKDGSRVLFMSETKDYLWGNLKYIHDRIVERGLDKEFKLDVACRKQVGNSSSVMSWIKTVYNVARHDYIFIDDYAPVFGFFKLSPKTKLIQVWHAGEGFKSVGYSRFGKEGSPFPSESCHKAYDYALTGSRSLVKVYEEVFGIEKDAFLPVGMARLDDFLDEEKITEFRKDFYKEYPQFEGKKIVLFAPTFRGTGQKTAYYDYDQLDLKQIYDFCGDEYVFLFKMHPFVDEKISIPEEYADRLFDFASYPNINDLYYVTELLITDYSSNYYEYALMKKPVLFFTYDRKTYELTRGVHRSVKECAPGKVCDSFDEMITALRSRDFEIEKIEKFVEDNFGEYDGHACDRTIDQILLKKER